MNIHPDVVKAYKKTLDAEDKHGAHGTVITQRAATRAANTLSNKIKQHHPDLDMKGKIKLRTHLQNMKEEMTTAADAGIPQDTANMGPLFKTYRVLDKRRKKNQQPRVLKRFKEYSK